MTRRLQFALGLAATYAFLTGLVALWGAGVWASLAEQERLRLGEIAIAHIADAVTIAVLVLIALGIALHMLFQRYVSPLQRVSEEARLILGGNTSHRMAAAGARELRELAAAVNQAADRHAALKEDVKIRVDTATATLQEERNRLGTLMSELAQSVLVCNLEGRILLYNTRARQLLVTAVDRPLNVAAGSPVGLGRSLFAIFDRHHLAHAQDRIYDMLQRGDAAPVASFVMTTAGDLLIRVQMAPVLDRQRTATGFVLILDNITEQTESAQQMDTLMQSLMEGSRASLANMRAAIETLVDYPDMDAGRQHRFMSIVNEEARALSARLEQTVGRYAIALKSQWPLEDMLGTDLIAAAQSRIADKLGITVRAAAIDSTLWLKADSYSLLQAMLSLACRLHEEFGVRNIELRLERAGRLAHLDVAWTGAQIPVEVRNRWEREPLRLRDETSLLTLVDVAARHAGEVWYQTGGDQAWYRLLIAVADQPHPALASLAAGAARPVYYDFDLFHRSEPSPLLDAELLTDLAYTVFDTETTGLDPSAGDEIISIGAVRIVNARLLRQEVFDQLVDPQRPVAPQSVAIHGIELAMLEGQPTISSVLPVFRRFCEDTVLVAHNAAFDLRFLQLKEAATGVRFNQPLLDTMLLSAVIHPDQESHSLEALAQRFGITMIGRHTALGDALVTGEVFLKMIPFLVEKGLRTLGQVRAAAQQTRYAHISY